MPLDNFGRICQSIAMSITIKIALTMSLLIFVVTTAVWIFGGNIVAGAFAIGMPVVATIAMLLAFIWKGGSWLD
jgi:hypothetical protein